MTEKGIPGFYRAWRCGQQGYFCRMIAWEASARVAWAVLWVCFRRRTRNRAEHIRALEAKVEAQADEITKMRDCAERFNVWRRSLNILVACDGPCNQAYMDDPSQVTDRVVRLCEANALRLRHWWDRGGQAAYQTDYTGGTT